MAKFYFRGIEVFNFNEKTKQFMIGEEAWQCMFISKDLPLMRKFISDCEYCIKDAIASVNNIEVD